MREKLVDDSGQLTNSPFEGGAEVPYGTEAGDDSLDDYMP